MQMDISIYQTSARYPLLIQQKSRAGPCQSNSFPSHNNTNVFPLRTVQLIRGSRCGEGFLSPRGTQDTTFLTSRGWPQAARKVVCLHSSSLHKVMQKWKCTWQTARERSRPAPPAHAILSTRAAAEWTAQHHCLWTNGAVCEQGFQRPSTPQWESSIYIRATQFINNGWVCRSPAPRASTCHKWLNDDTIKQS